MYFCTACNVYVKDCSVSEHDQSTAHLFAATKTPSLRKVWLPESNRGYQLLASMGWKEDSGLGPRAQGRVEPVATVFKTDRQGVGAPSMAKRRARVTHFPAHDERQQQTSADGLSDAQRMQEKLTRKRKQEAMDIMPLSKAQRKAKSQRDSKRDRAIGRELYTTGREGYEQYLS